MLWAIACSAAEKDLRVRSGGIETRYLNTNPTLRFWGSKVVVVYVEVSSFYLVSLLV